MNNSTIAVKCLYGIEIDEYNLILTKNIQGVRTVLGYYPPNKPEWLLDGVIYQNVCKRKDKTYKSIEEFVKAFKTESSKLKSKINIESIVEENEDLRKTISELKAEIKILKGRFTRNKNKCKKELSLD